jgi:hypothetical protein
MKRFFLFGFLFLLFVLPFVSAASFNISERTEYGIGENTVFLTVCDNVGKAQYIDVSSVFVDDVLTRGIVFDGAFLMKVPFNNVVYESVLSSVGKYSFSNVSVNNLSSMNYTHYFDSKGLEMLCESVLVDKSCMQSKSVNTYNFSSMEYQQLPVLKEKIVISGSKIEQKSLGIPLAKGGCVDLRYSYKHPLAYKLSVPANVNKYDIWIDNGIESSVLDPTWFNVSWNSSQEVNLSGVSANTTNYQLRLVIPKVANMNANFSDLRFLAPDNSSERPYWIETSNATQAIVWLNASIFNGTIAYMYYGNPSAISTSNGSNVFLFFDDFVGTTKSTKLTYYETAYFTQSDKLIENVVTPAWGKYAYNSSFYYTNVVYEIDYNITTLGAGAEPFVLFGNLTSNQGIGHTNLTSNGGVFYILYNLNADTGSGWGTGATYKYYTSSNLSAIGYVNAWNTYKVIFNSSGVYHYVNNTLYYANIGSSLPNPTTIRLGTTNTPTVSFDNIIVRTFLASEPTATFGSELSGCVENLSNSSSVLVANVSCLNVSFLEPFAFELQNWSYITYDVNSCGASNVTHYFTLQNVTCCMTDWINTTNYFVGNVSCLMNDSLNQSWYYNTYDYNACPGWEQNYGSFSFASQNVSCNFCSFNPQYLPIGEWTNVSCVLGDLMNQSAEAVQYDANYDVCYAVTGLPSDLWNGGVNISTYLYQLNGTCDFCTANLTNMSWSNWTFNFCMNTSYFNQSRSLVQYDVNGCVDEPNVTFYDYSYNSTACVNPSTVNINLGEIAIIFILALFALVLGLWGKQPVFLLVAALLFGVLSGMTWLSYGALLGVIFLVFTILSITLGLGMAWS